MNNTNITIIGSGNMGASLLGGLIKNGYSPTNICITDTDTNKLEQLKQKFNVRIASGNKEAVKTAEVIILAVKPQILNTIAAEIAPVIHEHKPLIISIAAGVRISSLQNWLGESAAIVRAMPNTPALISCGVTALVCNQHVTTEQHSIAESMLRAVGLIVWIDNEKLMDAVTAVSGSGPAYFFLVIEAMQKAAEQLGIPADTAKILTLQTAYGAARMALESDADIVQLRHNVTSPGGTTEQAIRVFEEKKIHDIFLQALQAAYNRSEELANLLDKTTET